MTKRYILLFLVVALLNTASSTVYHVVPEVDNDTISNAHTLQYYINNSIEYFTSNTKLILRPGQYYLTTAILFKDIKNFTMIGKNICKLFCTEFVSIVVINVTKFQLENIEFYFNNNPNNYKIDLPQTNIIFASTLRSIVKNNASIIFYHCHSVLVNNTELVVNAGIVGIAAINVMGYSKVIQTYVKINCSSCSTVNANWMQINGISLRYEDWNRQYSIIYRNMRNSITIDNLLYGIYGSCKNSSHYAIRLIFSQKLFNASFVYIQNVIFSDYKNTSFLYYFTHTCSTNLKSVLEFHNITVSRNVGNTYLKMFHLVLYNKKCFDTIVPSVTENNKFQFNRIRFISCTFVNNSDMKSMIYIEPTSSRSIRCQTIIRKCNFTKNINVNFVKAEPHKVILWQFTNFINISEARIQSNKHDNFDNLISVANTMISFKGPIFITHNTNYNNILALHFSAIVFNSYNEFSNNFARQIIIAKFGSYIIFSVNSTVVVSFNTVYTIVVQRRSTSEHTCPFQFYNNGSINFDKQLVYGFQVQVYSNKFITSRNTNLSSFYSDCKWLAGTAFQTTKAKDVFDQVFKINSTVIEHYLVRPIPSSVCLCSSMDNTGNCFTTTVGETFPGQPLSVNLIVPKYWLQQERLHYTTLVVKNSPNDECSIVDASQLSQTHFNYGCNQYSYTLWPFNYTTKTCKLFLGLESIPEMFYVQLKNCPKGFTLQEDKKACSCDPILQYSSLSITTCNLDDETVLRPANSWISASTTDNTHVYQVSSNCPFNYCLPHPSYLNLSSPNSQCQFDRSGVLCGQCEHGLSVVFGSSQCKHCSNIYLFIIIPIAIAGIILVTMLFIINLTVLNETINTFTFYVNIVNINMLTFYPVCQPGTCICTLISLFNLDLGIETCFYNGMDDYVKLWLELAFPLYLIIIAILLIIGSRYSTKVQRVTSRRALPVLATIFLLSYTKVLRTVGKVLFWYFTIKTLPDNKTTIVWSVDTTTQKFSVKFLVMFIVYFVIFLILLPFNLVLLFPRLLSRIKLISTFKPLLDTYIGPYKDKASYWTGLLFLVRASVLGLSALDKDSHLLATGVIIGLLHCLQAIAHPFKHNFMNIQESLLLFILLFAHLTPLYKNNFLGLRFSQALIAVGLVYLILVIILHCIMSKCKSTVYHHVENWYGKLCNKNNRKRKHDGEMNTLSNEIPDLAYNYKEFQEPLIGLD